MNIVRRWQNFWFRPEPLLNLALARILAVTFQMLTHVWWSPPIDDLPRLGSLQALHEPLALWRFLFRVMGPEWFPPIAFLEGVYWATTFFGLLALVGLKTRVSLSLFTLGWVIQLAHAYSFNEFHHQEAIIIFMLTFLALAPSGHVLSADRLLQRLRKTAAERRFVPSNVLAEASGAARWPFPALVVMFSLIYGSAAYAKAVNGGADWLNGYSLRYYLLQEGLWRNVPFSVGPAQDHPWFSMALSYGSVVFEAIFSLALFFPSLLPLFVLSAIAGHVGIWLVMRADFSEYIVLLLTLLPWAAVVANVKARIEPFLAPRRREVAYNGQCPRCLQSMALMDAFDWLGLFQPRDVHQPGMAEGCRGLAIPRSNAPRRWRLAYQLGHRGARP